MLSTCILFNGQQGSTVVVAKKRKTELCLNMSDTSCEPMSAVSHRDPPFVWLKHQYDKCPAHVTS